MAAAAILKIWIYTSKSAYKNISCFIVQIGRVVSEEEL